MRPGGTRNESRVPLLSDSTVGWASAHADVSAAESADCRRRGSFLTTDAHRFTRMAGAGFGRLGSRVGPPVADTLCVPVGQGPPGCASFGACSSIAIDRRPFLAHMRPACLGSENAISCLNSHPPLAKSSSSRPVGQTGVWSKLAWTQGPRRSTPLHAAGVQGRRSLGLTASHAQAGPFVVYLCASVVPRTRLTVCGQRGTVIPE